MKKSRILLIALFLCFTTFVKAQKAEKIGYVSLTDLVQAMPEKDSVLVKSQIYYEKLVAKSRKLQEEFQTQYEKYTKEIESGELKGFLKEEQEKDLQLMQQRIQEFEAKAQQDIQRNEQELTKPLFDKITKAVNEVAKENGYKYIIDSSLTQTGLSVLLYADETGDITKLVKAKLGMK